MNGDYDPFDLPDQAELQQSYADELRAARQWMLRSKHGLIYLHALLTQCELFTSGFVPGNPDMTAHNLGKRQLGFTVLNELTAVDATALERILRRADRVGD